MPHPNGFQGTMTALATPFRNGALDEEALRRLVADQIAGDVDVLVPCGTTGETATLTAEEQSRVIRIVLEEAKGRVPVMAGVGSNSTAQTIENARRAKEDGAQGLLVVTPYYNKPTQEGLYQHFKAVAESTSLPVMLYNVPGRTSVDLLPETIARLAGIPNIVGVKEASGSCWRALDVLDALQGRPFDLISGDDAMILPMLSIGGSGVISVISNVAPKLTSRIYRSFKAGDLATAAKTQLALQPLVRALFAETSPTPCKAALQMRGLMTDEVRLPLVPCSEPTRKKLADALEALKGLE